MLDREWNALGRDLTDSGKYDYEYMDYVIKVLVKCKDYGFRVRDVDGLR